MQAAAPPTTCSPSVSVARRRREQHARAISRHVTWLIKTFQCSAHHTFMHSDSEAQWYNRRNAETKLPEHNAETKLPVHPGGPGFHAANSEAKLPEHNAAAKLPETSGDPGSNAVLAQLIAKADVENAGIQIQLDKLKQDIVHDLLHSDSCQIDSMLENATSIQTLHAKCVALEAKLLCAGEKSIFIDKDMCTFILALEERLEEVTTSVATNADDIRKLRQGMCELEDP